MKAPQIFLLSIVFFAFLSCKKKKEGHTYNFHYSADNYPAGGWFDIKLYFQNFNRRELIVKNLDGYGLPISNLTINHKKIEGKIMALNLTTTPSGVDTTYYVLNGTVTNKKISGSYTQILPPSNTLPPAYGPFEIDLTKPIE